MTVDAKMVRALLCDFAGEEKYKKFVAEATRSIASRKRLRFWQESLWEAFVRSFPDCELSEDEFKTTFRVCELHDCELLQKDVPVIDACIDYAREYEIDWIRSFPHASVDAVSTEGARKTSSRHIIWYCPDCDLVRGMTKWADKKPDEQSIGPKCSIERP
jgi:hypothetical protein